MGNMEERAEKAEKIDRLEKHIDRLPSSDQVFAKSLVRGWLQYRDLTPKQWPWVDKLLEKIEKVTA